MMLVDSQIFVLILFPVLLKSSSFNVASSLEEPPEITEGPPKLLYYFQGNRVVLRCSAHANPAPDFEWFWNGEKLLPSSSKDQSFFHIDSTNTTSVIHLSTKALSGEHELQCYALNKYGVAISNLTILSHAVLEENQYSRTVVNMTATEGRPFILPCNHAISHPPASFAWYTVDLLSKKASSQTVKLSTRMTMDERGGLVFTSLSFDDVDVNRVYKCDAYNYVLRKTLAGSYYRVVVHKDPYNNMHAPDLIFSSSKVETTVGNNITLTCIFSGRPVPNIKWQRLDNKPISSTLNDNGRRLIKNNVSLKDDGMYRCIASNEVGESTAVVNLSVGDIPKLLTPMIKRQIIIGDSASFFCNCSGYPKPTYDWFINSLPLNSTNLSWINNEGSTLHLKNIDNSMMATVTCNASNKYGYQLVSSQLIVLELDNQTETIEATMKTYSLSDSLWKNYTQTLEHISPVTNFSEIDSPTENYNLSEPHAEIKIYGYHAHNYDFRKNVHSENENISSSSHSLNIFNVVWLLVFIFFVVLFITFLYYRSKNRRLSYQVNEPISIEWRYTKKETEYDPNACEQQGSDRIINKDKQPVINPMDHECYL